MGKDTESFLRMLEEQNARIAAREAEAEAQKPKPDELRLQRDAERREKWGQLRAREKPSKRPRRVDQMFS
jgi:hypothetical protein